MATAAPIIASVAIALAAFALVALSQEPKGIDVCTPLDERTKALLQKAFDEALSNYIEGLFKGALADRRAQPMRAVTGLHRAVTVHRNAIEALARIAQTCPDDD